MSEAYKIDWKEELIGGKVVAMSPASTNHTRIAGNIYHIFRTYLNGKNCEPFGDGILVYLTEEDEFIPDFMVVCDPDKVKADGIHGAPDLVVEILSPSTARNDKGYKKEVYAKAGVREYWIVSPADKVVDVYRSSGKNELLLHNTYAKCAATAAHFQCSLYDEFEIHLDEIFYRVQ